MPPGFFITLFASGIDNWNLYIFSFLKLFYSKYFKNIYLICCIRNGFSQSTVIFIARFCQRLLERMIKLWDQLFLKKYRVYNKQFPYFNQEIGIWILFYTVILMCAVALLRLSGLWQHLGFMCSIQIEKSIVLAQLVAALSRDGNMLEN